MSRRVAVVLAVLVASWGGSTATAVADPPDFRPGAAGLGDPYFPGAGNGGYNVHRYDLDLAYDPATDVLDGVATIRARATQDLSSFNLDFEGLEVRSVRVAGRPASWTREGKELVVTPARGLREGRTFKVVIAYRGVPGPVDDPLFGDAGFLATDDGALALGQPFSAATWYPVNDHPSDAAEYRIRITVPEGVEAISNGQLRSRRSRAGEEVWVWRAREPMASYLSFMAIGQFDVRQYSRDGLRFFDALDEGLLERFAPRTGERFAISQRAEGSYKRLTRTISVPEAGGRLSFWARRSSEAGWDNFFVEARTAGGEDWTTLRDLNGHTENASFAGCQYELGLHPFLTHYLTATEAGCDPTGTTGEWHAASGIGSGYEQWAVDLSAYAGKDVEISLSYASDDLFQLSGVVVDDIEVSTGEGSTSFEEDDEPMDGWTASGPPEGSPANENTWVTGTAADAPDPIGTMIQASFERQPDIISFLSTTFGPYPFRDAGGVVDRVDISFALETQTRPVYAPGFFSTQRAGDDVVVHELAHQWTGDKLRLGRWQDIWLNEGFATYAEWLWSEHEGRETAQQLFEKFTTNTWPDPADPFWSVTIGHPQDASLLFDTAVYYRGAMTLQALRNEMGDPAFFGLLRSWGGQSPRTVTTDDFIRAAEEVAGRQLDAFFERWLFTPARPDELPAAPAPAPARADAQALLDPASPLREAKLKK
ncbi:MAG: putative metallopeptidase [uncultured Thermoleophilia bacterium]|uniref:Putative metallopeptidase n=1 Tax=uncultured Thermoleophilia bacterium TaxID=1497501 RepID=A0A6J4USD9_9ACTN|nr:MAG: putative metallopeptidase [uncultured Thermoleophilia bacterium]